MEEEINIKKLTEWDDTAEVVVLIPTSKKDKKLAVKTAYAHKMRAGIPCNVAIIENNVGWVKAINVGVQNIKAKYYVYSCADYFPGKHYLKKAMVTMLKTGNKLVGFNDGKWEGNIATVGLIEAEWMKTLYGGDLLYKGYENHYADTELTNHALEKNVYVYCPDAILIEIDYTTYVEEKGTKAIMRGNKKYNMKDKILFDSRWRLIK